jgi:hypothetical protein
LEGIVSLELPWKMAMHTRMGLQVLEQAVLWVEGLAQCKLVSHTAIVGNFPAAR